MIVHQLVHEANLPDYEGGKRLLAPLGGVFPRLRLIWADSAYKCLGFPEWVKTELGCAVEIVAHPDSGQRGVWSPAEAAEEPPPSRPSGFRVLPRRWVVERTFAWLSTWRRLAKDYELLPSSEEAWIYLAMIRIMVRRVASDSS